MKRMLWLAVLCLAFSFTANAEIKAKAFTITPMIGGHSFEGNLNLDDSPFLGIGLGYNLTDKWAIEGVFTNTNADGEEGASDADVQTYRIDALYHLWPDKALVPYLAAGLGGISTDYDRGDDHDHLLLNYGAGIKYFILDDLIALRADVRHLLDFPEPDNSLQYSVGLTFQLGKATPTPAPVVEKAPAPVAAPAPMDSDNDGIIDDLDQCPGTPAGVAVDSKGCPLDNDGDGVYDYLDKCPGTPAGVAVDGNGCPFDNDGDGVYDYLDKCPGTPAGVTVDSNGCPFDTDGDGVYDYLDKCPGTPAGVTVNTEGCPAVLTLHINFGHDSSNIGPEYDSEIAKAAQCINSYPGERVYIDGHTDSDGKAAYNQKLSVKRATAVMNRLVDHFDIEAERLEARGFGEDRPIATNATAEGKANNRRVEVACGAK